MTVAHYYFRQQTAEGCSATNNIFAVMHSMLSAIVNQIAMGDKAFCDQVATTITSIREDIVTPDAVARFEKFLAFKFKETAFDELAEAEKIHIAKDDVKNDVQVIAASKDKAYASRLRKLRPAAKRIVENTLVEHVEQITDVVKLRGLFKLFNIEEEISSRSGLVLTVARDLGRAIFDSEDSDDVDRTTNWALHFNDIDPSTMTDEAFDRGLHILLDVLPNKNNVATFVEKNHILTANSPPYFYIDNSTLCLHACTGEARVENWGDTVQVERRRMVEEIGWRVEAIEATFKASENALSNAGACQALAVTLREYRHYQEATKWAKTSQESADNDLDRFAALVEQAAAELQAAKSLPGDYEDDDEDAKNHEYEKPYATIVSAMEIRPTKVKTIMSKNYSDVRLPYSEVVSMSWPYMMSA
ncbi:unnamed protein product [Alternaria alternata]